MSRGLGWLQREILATLEEAKEAMVYYRGGARSEGTRKYSPPGWVVSHGRTVRLAEDVFDLRASSEFLARRHGRTLGCYPTESFAASFSRAVRGLLRGGHLERLTLVPLADTAGDVSGRGEDGLHHLRDGLHMTLPGRQTRFVRRKRYGCCPEPTQSPSGPEHPAHNDVSRLSRHGGMR